MAEAFATLGNHLVSDSVVAINASDDLSTIDPDESVLGRDGAPKTTRRRRGDDDEETDVYDEETDVYDEDDMESLISQPVNGVHGKPGAKAEEEVELPAHACA